ncbi:hypothetical protein SUGI_0978550 [Cryptomeria japonica]|nr:hypothetical protein SUGI_0978550 [Cryptomeria japonica]
MVGKHPRKRRRKNAQQLALEKIRAANPKNFKHREAKTSVMSNLDSPMEDDMQEISPERRFSNSNATFALVRSIAENFEEGDAVRSDCDKGGSPSGTLSFKATHKKSVQIWMSPMSLP